MNAIILLGLVVLLSEASVLISQKLDNTRSDMVYAICNQSRISPDIGEQECGRLQDKWHRKFLCENANTKSNNKCWVETK